MTEEQILISITKMRQVIGNGYSIEVAKRRCHCHTHGTPRYFAITRHPEYLKLLNEYSAARRLNVSYEMRDGRIVQKNIERD